MYSTKSAPSSRLPVDSLAYSIRHSSALVAAVIKGENLTGLWERALFQHGNWEDSVRGAVRDLAWNTLRDYGRGDLILSQLVSRPLPTEVRALLLVTIHRLESRPEQAYKIVDQAVEAVNVFAPGMKGLVNGVLRNGLRQWDELQAKMTAAEVSRWCHPSWWIDRVRSAHPQQWEEVLATGNTRPPMGLRPNARRISVNDYACELDAAGIEYLRSSDDMLRLKVPVPVSRLPGFSEGQVSVQDIGAQYAARLLPVSDGDRVLDACAAPGGKSAHLLELRNVDLLALDIDSVRLLRIQENLDRLSLTAKTQVGDAREVGQWWDGRPFNHILADVPCSASGVVRRHPDIKWHRRADDIARFALQQGEILDALWHTLAPGGTMLYATCSVFDEENRIQIEKFCHRHSDAKRQPLHGRMDLQLLPNAEHDGFYYALLSKGV